MPFHPHHQHSYSDTSQNNFYSVANAVYQSGQTLASAGVPPTAPGPWLPTRNTQQGPIPPLPYSNGSISRRSSLRYAPPGYLENLNQSQGQGPLASPRAATNNNNNSASSGFAMSDAHQYSAPPAYGGNDNISVQVQPATPGHPPPQQLPSQGRPVPLANPNAAASLPTLPQISTQMQQQGSLSARPSVSQQHSYSKSSPGSMDLPGTPKYKAFSNTPENQKFMSPQSYGPPSASLGPHSYSPLGLADIRPRVDTQMEDSLLSPMGATTEVSNTVAYQTNSNYLAPWPIFAVDWCKWPPKNNGIAAGKIALGSYLEDNHNYIQILDAQRTQIDPDNPSGERGLEFVKTAEANHAYPVTRILWEPPSSNKQTTDLLATSGDHLRLWSLPAEHQQSYTSNSITRSSSQRELPPLQKLSPLALLSNSKSPEHTAPITSLDWNIVQPSLIITSSIDTTCTIWDIPTLTAKTQLIAHDKEVFDVRFCANSIDVFVSCGADGSVRMFDLRSLEHSTIIYEPSEKTDKPALSPSQDLSVSPRRSNSHSLSFPPPLLRISASPHDAHLLATFSQDSSLIRILDVRQPGQALLELKGHGASVNCIEWSSTNRGILASGGDDCCVLLWDLVGASSAQTPAAQGGAAASAPGQDRGPLAAWDCGVEVSNLSWAPVGSTLGIAGGRGLWGVGL